MYAGPLLYLMLLRCIKIHPSMPIFNVSSRSFFQRQRVAAVHGGCHRGAAITQSHYRKHSALPPPPPRSSFSVFLHNYLKVITEINGVLSLPRALPKPRIITARTQYLSSPLVQDFINTQQHAQHAAHLYPFDLLPSGPLVHHKIGSVCSCFMKP